jgi:CxxC-x17-CxxC domain-containing protein
MGNFRNDNRSFGRDRHGPRGSFGDRRDGGRDRGRSRGSFGGRGRDRPEMHDVTCDKCGKECQVPFRPSGDKPVFCSNCYEKQEGNSRARKSFSDSQSGSNSAGSGISKEQFNEINTKLDKILGILEMIEFEDEEELEDEESDGEGK